MTLMRTTPVQIRKKGLDALAKALGPLGMIRFLQQYDMGSGNYTQERRQWLKEETLSQIVGEIKSKRA